MIIGNVKIDKPVILAPMENVTDLPFRLVCKRMGASIVFTEFVNSEGLIRENVKTKSKMAFMEEERPFAIQLYGSEESSMEQAAWAAEKMNPDFIDINCGCWVRDVAMRGAGAGLLKDLPKMERIIRAVVNATKFPVTVKTRLGWDENSIRIVEVAKMVENSGARALTIHCRTRAQAHKGAADYSWIPKVKEAVLIPIIANGGIESPEDVKSIFDRTGCDGVMIGQAAVDNPWIFRSSLQYLQTGKYDALLSWDERVHVALEHLKLSVEYKGERRGVLEMRKHYSGYFKGIPNISILRNKLMTITAFAAVEEEILRYRPELSL